MTAALILAFLKDFGVPAFVALLQRHADSGEPVTDGMIELERAQLNPAPQLKILPADSDAENL